jgi:hypothetical protein
MSKPIDREQLRRDLSDALGAIQRDQDVTGPSTDGCCKPDWPRCPGTTAP